MVLKKKKKQFKGKEKDFWGKSELLSFLFKYILWRNMANKDKCRKTFSEIVRIAIKISINKNNMLKTQTNSAQYAADK